MMGPPTALYIDAFQKDSVFLDIDSSWHSKLNRKRLLPQLKEQGIKPVKLHYDIIPVLFPETSHPNTVAVFDEHFHSHLEHTELFLCISNKTLEDVEDYCEKHKRKTPNLESIRLGTNLPLNQAPSVHEHPNSNLAQSNLLTQQYILCVGTLEPRKNHQQLLDAFDQVCQKTNLSLIIVGKPGWLADHIQSQIEQHVHYGTRVHHLEAISDFDLAELYRHAWVNVVPSLYEGFGLPVIEALSRGCPTICANTGSLPEVGGRFVRTFSPYSVEELSELLIELLEHDEQYQELKSTSQQFRPVPWSQTVEDIDSLIYSKV